MRTTVVIEDDVLEAARKLAATQGRSLGQVVSELMRRGLTARTSYPSASGFPTFEVREDSPPLTLEDVKRGEEVVVTWRGKPRARVVGLERRVRPASRNPAFGIWKDRDIDVRETVDRLREPRFF